MASDDYLITVERTRANTRTFIVLQPRIQPCPQGELVGRHKRPLLPLCESLGELIGDLLTCFAVEGGALEFPRLGITPNGHLCHPEPILTPCDRTLIVPAFLRHRA